MNEATEDILLIEDNPGDVRLVKEALQDTDSTLYIVSDGEEALDFLNQRNEFTDVPQPDAILLDLNLPGKNGNYVFDEINNDSNLREIRVIILTSISEDRASIQSTNPGVDAFLTKPANPDEFISHIRSSIFEQ